MAGRGGIAGEDRVWQVGAAALALMVLLPVATLAWPAAQASSGLWSHLGAYVLPYAGANTLLLLISVGALTGVIGTGSAWLVTAYDFPGRRSLTWMLLLPLA